MHISNTEKSQWIRPWNKEKFDEYGNGYGYINDKEDKKEDELMDDIEELKRLSSKR